MKRVLKLLQAHSMGEDAGKKRKRTNQKQSQVSNTKEADSDDGYEVFLHHEFLQGYQGSMGGEVVRGGVGGV